MYLEIEYLLSLSKTPIGNILTTEFLTVESTDRAKEVIVNNASAVADYKAGKANALQFHRLVPQLKELSKKQRSISRVQFFSGSAGIKRAYLEGEAGKLPPVKDRIVRVISDGETWEHFWQEAARLI